VLALYVFTIAHQPGAPEPWRHVFVVAFLLLVIAVLLTAGFRARGRLAGVLLAFAAVALLALGYLAIFSVGFGLIAAGAVALLAASRRLRSTFKWLPAIGAFLGAGAAAIGLLALGMYISGLGPPGCPTQHGHAEGAVTDGSRTVHFACQDGRLLRSWTDN
jgi:hypothetical protein